MNIALKNTFESVTIVSMCFNMGMDSLNKVKREKTARESYREYYVESARQLCRLFGNVIIFCDDECGSILLNDEHCNRAIVRIMSLEDIFTWKYVPQYTKAYENMERVLDLRENLHFPSLIRYGCIVIRHQSNENAKYTALNQAKPYLCAMAIKQNPYDTRYFYWIDAGSIIHEKYAMFWKGWEGDITYRPHGVRISLGIHPKLLRCWIIGKHLWGGEKSFAFGFWPSPQAAACIFGGQKDRLLEFAEKFESVRGHLLSDKNWTSSEQGIMTIMIKKYPDLFDIPIGLSGYQRAAFEVFNQKENIKVF